MSEQSDKTGMYIFGALVALSLSVGVIRCHNKVALEEKLDAIMAHADTAAYVSAQLITDMENYLAAQEYESMRVRQEAIADMQAALYSNSDMFGAQPMSFGNYETRNDDYVIARHKNKLAMARAKVETEFAAVKKAVEQKDLNSANAHKKALDNARDDVDAELTTLSNYGVSR